MFYIGPPPGWMLSSALGAVARNEIAGAARIDERLELRITPGLVVDIADGEPVQHRANPSDTQLTAGPGNRIVLDAQYRIDRLRYLMREAAEARSTPPEDPGRRHRSDPGTPATGQGSPSDGSRRQGP